MPITSSAKKALRASNRKRVFNIRRKSAIDEVMKDLRGAIAAKKVKEANALLVTLQKTVDKAAKSNFIKKNAASRMKSRAAAKVRVLAGK